MSGEAREIVKRLKEDADVLEDESMNSFAKTCLQAADLILKLEGERDEYRDLLRDLVMLDAEAWATGGGPGYAERHKKAWDAAQEKFKP